MKKTLKKHIGIYLIIAGLFSVSIQTASSLPYTLFSPSMENTGWLYVGGGGPNNYTSIQNAIDDAITGDTIYVYSNTYMENIVIDKAIMLIGENRTTTIIEGNNLDSTINITSNSIILQGFTIKNDGSQDGIYTSTSSHTFSDNIFTHTSRGIHLYYSSENTLVNNSFYDNTHSGVYMQVGQNNTISGNELYNNTDEAIYLTGCGTTIIEQNSIKSNNRGINAFEASGNIIRDNIIEFNSYGIYFGGMITLHSNFNTISHNQINNNTNIGIHIQNSQFNTIEFNEIKDNGKGIQFRLTGANAIRNNNITSSDITEIELTFSLGDQITKNNIDNSQLSLVLIQINFGFSIAVNNWWGSNQWPIRRVRPIAGWVIVTPWQSNPYTFSVGPE